MSATSQVPHSASFFRNVECPYFPCHSGIADEEFNCLFCYCPLYALGTRCGGDYAYTASGIKDCSGCTRLHRGDQGARIVKAQFAQLAELARADRLESQTQHEAHHRAQDASACADDKRDDVESGGTPSESITNPAAPATTSNQQTAPLSTKDESHLTRHVS